jgi:hypothetical protein
MDSSSFDFNSGTVHQFDLSYRQVIATSFAPFVLDMQAGPCLHLYLDLDASSRMTRIEILHVLKHRY